MRKNNDKYKKWLKDCRYLFVRMFNQGGNESHPMSLNPHVLELATEAPMMPEIYKAFINCTDGSQDYDGAVSEGSRMLEYHCMAMIAADAFEALGRSMLFQNYPDLEAGLAAFRAEANDIIDQVAAHIEEFDKEYKANHPDGPFGSGTKAEDIRKENQNPENN